MIKQISVLQAQARHETCPTVDVTEKVMTLLCANEPYTVALMHRPLAWFAAIASTVAVSLAALAVIQHLMTAHPLLEVANSISWVVQ